MVAAVWLMLSTLLYSLQLSTGSFPKPLTEAEERRYVEQARNGDLEARNILIERNMRLVSHIMKKYYAQTSDQEDLISIGTIGLIKGIETFDPGKGARLATYAARCVEKATPSLPRHIGRLGVFHRFNLCAEVTLWDRNQCLNLPLSSGASTSVRISLGWFLRRRLASPYL